MALIALAALACRTAVADQPKTPKTINEWIEQLGSREYATRQRAEKHLASLGFDAFDALKEAEDHPDVEIAAQARYLSERITIAWVQPTDSADVQQLLQNFDELSFDKRKDKIRELTSHPDAAGIIALCRIVRFEKTQEISKRAALQFLQAKADKPEFWQRHAESIGRGLAACQRPAARWLRVQLVSLTDKPAALAEWTKLIAEEQQSHIQSPTEPAAEFTLALMRHKIDLLKQLDRREEALAMMLKMIEMEQGKPESLAELVDWLAKEKAWNLVDQVAARFKAQFESSAFLLYTLAQARLTQGDEKEAQATAEKALALPGDSTEHLRIAMQLQERGLAPWAEGEYRLVIKLGPAAKPIAVYASLRLSELLHDQAKDLAAAEALQKLTQLMQKDPNVMQAVETLDRTPGSINSRMEYFFALHEEQQKNFDKQREHLDKAIAHDRTDADVLIAMFRLSNATDAYRKKTSAMIRRAAADFQRQIDESPENSSLYNQWAWLIGNTEGDYAKAVQYSHKSLELRPGTAGYLDTLGRCYYTSGDLANAVKYQQQAVDLEPHSLVIVRQLELFKRARTEKEPTP